MPLEEHLIAKTQPKANQHNIVLWKDYRVTVLGDRLFRIEQSATHTFCDDATQKVWFRNMPPQEYETDTTEDALTIRTSACTLTVKAARKDWRIAFKEQTLPVSNVQNLGGTYRTLDGCNGEKYIYVDPPATIHPECGICSKSGVAVLCDDSLLLKSDGTLGKKEYESSDEYIFAFGNDYRAAVKALFSITGNPPVIPRFAFGNWWSRYHDYSDKEYLRLINAFEEHDVPLTVATVDMDWHYSDRAEIAETFGLSDSDLQSDTVMGETIRKADCQDYGWTGYTWNKRLFPDYKDFLKKLAAKNLKITLNLHPAEGIRCWEDCYADMAKAMGVDPATRQCIPFDQDNPQFMNNYFSVVHKPMEEDGVAFWWIDWQQGTEWGTSGTDPLWALNHYHYLDNAKNHSTPLILSRYAGIGSHRYPLGFSGDTSQTWNTLRYLPYFTAMSSNAGYTWWSHDIGGHGWGRTDGELYIRFLQYGVFSPVNRLHCTNDPTTTKEPWAYVNGTGTLALEWLRFRHRLIPFLYTCGYRTHSEGKALIEPLYYEYPTASEAYAYKNEYLFGGLLVAPVTAPRKADGYARTNVWIPEGKWTDIFTGDEYTAPVGGVCKTLLRPLESIPVLAKAGTILPLSRDHGNSVQNPESLEIRVYNGNGTFALYENNAENGHDGEAITTFTAALHTQADKSEQTLCISAKGDDGVIPKNRILTVRFPNVEEGKIEVFENEKAVPAEEILSDCVAVKIPFDAKATYRITVTFTEDEHQKRLARAREVLLRAETETEIKRALYKKLKQTTNAQEYLDVLDEVALRKPQKACKKVQSLKKYVQTIQTTPIEKAILLRLKETL